MKIIKRNGTNVEFEKEKIQVAISKANKELQLNEQISDQVIEDIATKIFLTCQSKGHEPTVEEVQDMVIDEIASRGYYTLMRTYASYRYKRELLRKANTTDGTIISLIEGNNNELNTENSNKSTVLNSTQRDYIAGEVSKDISKRIMLPERVVKAHNEGILHFHDLDYFIQPMHNCFRKDTRFVTKDGIRSFNEFQDGEKTYVLDMNGDWRLATVRNYGKQQMQTVILRSGKNTRTVECTENHRWILKDGSVTTNLKEGDILWPLHEINNIKYPYYPSSYREKMMFAFGMILGDGSDIDHGVRITLCGDKVKYEDIFKEVGYRKYNILPTSKHRDIIFGKSCNLSKQKFLSAKGWEYLQEEDKVALFFGYYAADGCKNGNIIHTADDRLAEMIRSISSLAGYHISKEKEIIHDTNFKENARLIQFNFRRNQPNNLCWIVDKITHGCGKMWKNYEFEAWCVEEPVTHSFTLEGGIVTGNCAVIDIDDMLTNGTVMNGKMIESPHTFRVACTVSTQIMAAIASNQYGGQSVDISHFGKFLRRSKEKFEKRIRETVSDTTDEATIQKLIDVELQEELSAGVQTMQYQINSLMTTNGQSPFVTLFLNLFNENEKEYIEENAMIVEEIIKQRITGIKNESGVYITPAFPKLIYVLDEFNNLTGGKYDYITELAVECTAKRMYPDYVSAKKMREYYDGNVFPIMGCLDRSECIVYDYNGVISVESIERLWDKMVYRYVPMLQRMGDDHHKYIDIPDGKLKVYDSKLKEFTPVYRLIKNWSNDWRRIKFNNGRCITVTADHPFETMDRGVVYAKDLHFKDLILCNFDPIIEKGEGGIHPDIAWMLGILLCDSAYVSATVVSIALTGEDEIEDKLRNVLKTHFGYNLETIERHRGVKGNYKDLKVRIPEENKSKFSKQIMSLFGGMQKIYRKIPREIFTSSRETRLAFLAGMIDADGNIICRNQRSDCRMGSINKELAMQQMYLAQSLGMPAKVYMNRYRGTSDNEAIRYMVTFEPSMELKEYIQCAKKKDNIIENSSPVDWDCLCSPMEIEVVNKSDWSYDLTTESEHFEVDGIYSHNCRSLLSPWKDQNGNYKFEGRFNCGVVSINLPQIGIVSNGDEDVFWKEFDNRLEICFEALMEKHKNCKRILSDNSPIHFQHGAISRLKVHESIDKLLYGGYSTLSLGYIGLYELTKIMTGYSHTDSIGLEFALKVMHHLRETTDRWKAETNIGFALYGTPAESLCKRFCDIDTRKFGIIKDVTDKGWYTNSYHVDVREHIDAFSKLKFESQFQPISSGGCISYVEIPNMSKNIAALREMVKFIYDTILYGEFNTKSDYCQVCGFDGEITLNEQHEWQCPQCGNKDKALMNVTRRTCGYLGENFWNDKKTLEIENRVLHTS